MSAVEAHIATCHLCAQRLRDYQQLSPRLDAGINALLHEAPQRLLDRRFLHRPDTYGSGEHRGWRPWTFIIRGASLVLFVLILLVLARAAPSSTVVVETANRPTRTSTAPVVLASITGLVDPAVESYVQRAVVIAEARQATLVLTLSTPGGHAPSIEAIGAALANSSVPTVVYLWPSGARVAGSAGVIVQAADSVGVVPGDSDGSASGLMAANLPALLESIDGRIVQTRTGPATFATAGASPQLVEMEFWELLAHRLLDPSVAYLLFVLGLFAVLLELTQPGGFVLGTMGLLGSGVGLVAFATVLPVNWLGVALIVGGIALFAVELKAATHGASAVLGAGCLLAGSMLVYGRAPEIAVAPAVQGATAGLGLLLGVWVARTMSAVRHRPAMHGFEELEGARGVTRTLLDPAGVVYVQGQLWSAQVSADRLEPGEPIRVLGRRGLVLDVESATFRGAATQKGVSR
jgi:membrane-bound ClpP family serine protease